MKRIALIFDDGPSAEQRIELLAVLGTLKVRVTFACVGKQLAARPDLAKAASDKGHEQVNHSYSHAHCNQLEHAELEADLSRTNDLLELASGQPPAWFWPPYLECDDSCNAVVEMLGMKTFTRLGFRIVSSDDWNVELDGETIFKNSTTGVVDRCIVVFHEWRTETLQQLPSIIAELQSQGVQFVTFSELAAT